MSLKGEFYEKYRTGACTIHGQSYGTGPSIENNGVNNDHVPKCQKNFWTF